MKIEDLDESEQKKKKKKHIININQNELKGNFGESNSHVVFFLPNNLTSSNKVEHTKEEAKQPL